MEKATKKVFFVRHGESEANVTPVFQDSYSPLTARGKEQAQFMAKRASRLPIEGIISSSMTRARETADIIARRCEKDMTESDVFVERKKPTVISGEPFSNTSAQDIHERWIESLFVSGMYVEDGENFDQIKARAIEALHYLSQREETSIMVVTHGFFLRTIAACIFFGEALKDFELRTVVERLYIENTGLTVCAYDPDLDGMPWWVHVWNDHAHLG